MNRIFYLANHQMAPFPKLEFRGVVVVKHFKAAVSSMAVMQRHNTSTQLIEHKKVF